MELRARTSPVWVRLGLVALTPLALLTACLDADPAGVRGPLAPVGVTNAQPGAVAQISQAAIFSIDEIGPTTLIDRRLQPAPDEFESIDEAIWDGRRTLQGIWVAHPEADSARRVRIVNLDTGDAVDGALFRRDTSSDGPAVLVSSDAAVTLGMEPDQPVRLSIVAIRRSTRSIAEASGAEAAENDTNFFLSNEAEDDEPVATAEVSDADEAPSVLADLDGAATQEDTRDVAALVTTSVVGSADTDVTDARPSEQASEIVPAPTEAVTEAPVEGTISEPTDGEPTSLDAAPIVTAVVDTDVPEATGATEAVEVAGPDAAAPVAAASADTDASDLTKPGSVVEDWPLLEAAEMPPVSAEATATQPVPEAPTPAPAKDPEPAEVTVAAIDPTPPAAPPVADQPAPRRPFIQSGIFGVQSNADRLIRRLSGAGFPTEGKRFQSGERTLTRVVSGPFETQAELDRALREIRRIGPSDALPVRR
ncbi:MAG: SPOR domain-containing protein [Pseudomonadota bacterium]